MIKQILITLLSLVSLAALIYLLAVDRSKSRLKITGTVTDITEDFHHRMLAGVLELEKEPVIVSVIKNDRHGQRFVDVPDTYLNINWELGSFWVKTDDSGLVVSHWNPDVIYGHVKVAASRAGAGTRRYFLQDPRHPVRMN